MSATLDRDPIATVPDFDVVHDRSAFGSAKWANRWDEYSPLLAREPDVLPLWTADMDFTAPDCIVERLTAAAQHGIYGYTLRDPEHFELARRWFATRHGWTPDSESLLPAPGIMPAMALILQTFTEPGDGIIVQTPVYSPYFEVVQKAGRKLLVNQLRLSGGVYGIDWDDLDRLAGSGAKALILCNPHNPSGLAWTPEDLSRIAAICDRHGMFVISDEIHCDIRLSGVPHTVYASVSDAARNHSFVCTSPTKTFNLAGLHCAIISIANPSLRQAYFEAARAAFLTNANFFSRLALETAYREGGPWLDALTAYLRNSLAVVDRIVTERLPGITLMRPDASFLAWLDARELEGAIGNAHTFFVERARVNLYSGRVYGPGGEGFLRLNIGCPLSTLVSGLDRMADALGEAGLR